MPDTNLPQVMLTMTSTTKIKISDSDVQSDFILNVMTGLLWSHAPICNVAVNALSEIGLQAVPHLLKAFASQSLAPQVQDAVAQALGRIKGVESATVAQMVQLVDEGLARPQALLTALAKIAPDDPGVLKCLEDFALNAGDARQVAAIDALNILGSYRAQDILSRVPERQPAKDEQRLTRQLQSKSGRERLSALDAMQRHLPDGADVFVNPVLDLIDRESDKEVRRKAARFIACAIPCTSKALSDGLAQLMDPGSRLRCAIDFIDSREPIFVWLSDLICSTSTAPTIRYMATRIFRSYGSTGVPYLVTGLWSFSGHPQHILARELGKMGKLAAAAVPELLRIIRHSRSFPWGGDRSAILDALAQIAPDDERVVACLSGIAGNQGDSWHHASVLALSTIDNDRVGPDDQLSQATRLQEAEDIKQFVGMYFGTLQEERGVHETDTILAVSQTDDRKLIGEFVIHTGSFKEYGELTLIRPIRGDRKLTMEWSDAHGNGSLEATFSNDFSEFDGRYFLDSKPQIDETGKDSQRRWTGRRQA